MRNMILQLANLNEEDRFVDLGVEGRIILGRNILKQCVGCGLDFRGSEEGSVLGYREHGNESSRSIS